MNLTDTLFVIENFLGIETDSLLPFAEQDSIGGYHPDPTQSKWHIGSMFGVEGQVLYSLIRSLQPRTVVEIGSGLGCSANHIAAALSRNYVNPATAGHLTTLDRGNTPHIFDEFKAFVTVIAGDGIAWLEAQPDHSVDFIFEDADHSELMCYQIGELAKRKLVPGGVLVAHDAAHYAVGADVRAGFIRASIEGRVYLTEPSDCGLLVWRKHEEFKPLIKDMGYSDPQLITDLVFDEPVLQAQEDKPKVKRTRKAAK